MANNSSSRWVKRLILFALLAALLGGGVWYFAHARSSASQYQVSTVARGDLTQVVTATGQLNPVVNVQVGSQISGIIQKLYVDFNSPVKAGQVLAQIDPATYSASVHQNEADLANAKAALELSQLNARRAE